MAKKNVDYAGPNTIQRIADNVKSGYVKKEEGKGLISDSDLEQITTNKNSISEIQAEIVDGTGSAPLIIVVRASEGYNTKEVTATSQIDGSTYTETIQEGLAIIKVKLPGEYKLTNTLNNNTLTAVVGEPFKDEVQFTEFQATIKVTIPELLIGETIQATDGTHTVEQKAESTTVSLGVLYKGSWDVSVKGSEFVSKQTVSISEEGETKTCTLSTASGVPYVTVTLAPEFIGETIVCSKDDIQTKKKSESETVQFFIRELGEYTIALEESEHIKETVNVNSAKEFKVELTLDDTTVPILIVTSKIEDNGKTIKVSKDEHNLSKVLENKKALFVLPEQGEWTVTCDDYPEITKKKNVNANKAFKVAFRATLFGLKVIQTESDPKKRITPLEDLVGLTPITVNTQDGTVDYGDMPDYFLYQAMNHVVLKSIDKSEEIELNPNDYSQKLEGGAAPDATATSNYNTFAKVDKLYMYEYSSGGEEYYYISDEKLDDNYTAIGFTKDDDSEADSFYMATFCGSYDSQNRLRSVSNVNIRNNTSYTDFAAAARKNGNDYTMEQHQMINFYEVAYLMMVQDFNSQTAVGRGRDMTQGGSNTTTQKTGFANTKGPVAYDTSSQAIKFMHVEDLWFNSGYSWEEGWVTQNSNTYVRMKPPYITAESGGTSTYTQVTGASTKNGSIKYSVADNKWGRCPADCTGSDSTYECDYYNMSTNSTLCACSRGYSGLFNRSTNSFSSTNHFIVARLSLLP